jgi:hypothetical protein
MIFGKEGLQIESEVVHLNFDTGRLAGLLHADDCGD